MLYANYPQSTIDHIKKLVIAVDKYVKQKYNNAVVETFDYIEDSGEYWRLFDANIADAIGISDAMFILPNGKLKKLNIDLSDFQLDGVPVEIDMCHQNAYAYLFPRHEYVRFFGFELEKLLNSGCFRIGNNINTKEIHIQAHLAKSCNKAVFDVLELCLYSYDTVIIDCSIEKPSMPYIFSYSKKAGDTICDIKRELNKLTNNKGYTTHVRYN